jgi:hypothetical protein
VRCSNEAYEWRIVEDTIKDCCGYDQGDEIQIRQEIETQRRRSRLHIDNVQAIVSNAIRKHHDRPTPLQPRLDIRVPLVRFVEALADHAPYMCRLQKPGNREGRGMEILNTTFRFQQMRTGVERTLQQGKTRPGFGISTATTRTQSDCARERGNQPPEKVDAMNLRLVAQPPSLFRSSHTKSKSFGSRGRYR